MPDIYHTHRVCAYEISSTSLNGLTVRYPSCLHLLVILPRGTLSFDVHRPREEQRSDVSS